MKIIEDLLPYNNLLDQRELSRVDLVVLHCTELPGLKEAREYGERILYEDGTGNSGHYYIDRTGRTYRYVTEDRVARHAVGHNWDSIGIEIVNLGRYPHWLHSGSQEPTEPYTAEQLKATRRLLSDLKRRIPTLKRLARHSDLDTRLVPAGDDPELRVRRKIDPGPMFPWDEILSYWNTLL